MTNSHDNVNPATGALSWRAQAARIVEELFRSTPAPEWDALLDLRGSLLHETDCNHMLDLFLACRERLEADHYLPFYRLRRLLTASLRLDTGFAGAADAASLTELLHRKPRSLADVARAVRRELFEHTLDLPAAPIPVRVVERV